MGLMAGFVDSIGGGGGLISLPSYLLAGIPTHMAIGTNKLSSAAGTSITTARFIKEKLVDYKLCIPCIATAFLGAFCGARLSMLTDEKVLKIVLIPVLCIALFFMLNRKLFGANEENKTDETTLRTMITASVISLCIGMYDGFYGPGTGTFLIIGLNVIAHLKIKKANAQAKVINLATNITSLVVFILGGQVIWKIGVPAMICNMLGNYIGSNLAVKNAEKITKPIILFVLTLLFVKIIFGL